MSNDSVMSVSIRKTWIALIFFGWTAGCGGNVEIENASGAGASAGSGGTTNTGGNPQEGGSGGTTTEHQSGDCTPGSATDVCPHDGSVCTEIVPGGFRICAKVPEESTECFHPQDECCDSSDCKQGACFPIHQVPLFDGCNFGHFNVCAVDTCKSDIDCPDGAVCIPEGSNGMPTRRCLRASCRKDKDCQEKEGGICAPVQAPCCGDFAALLCVYPGNGCRKNADCPGGKSCMPDVEKGIGTCTDAIPCWDPPDFKKEKRAVP